MSEDDDTVHDEEWVTRVVHEQNANAALFVPILRPLLPQAGLLVAHKDLNSLIMVDRYGNTKRIIELIRTLDQEATQQTHSAARSVD